MEEGGHAQKEQEDTPVLEKASEHPTPLEDAGSGIEPSISGMPMGIDSPRPHIIPPSSPPPMPSFGKSVPSASDPIETKLPAASSSPETKLPAGVKVIPPRVVSPAPAETNGLVDKGYPGQEAAHADGVAKALMQVLQSGGNQPASGSQQPSGGQQATLLQMLQPGGNPPKSPSQHETVVSPNMPRVVPPPPPKVPPKPGVHGASLQHTGGDWSGHSADWPSPSNGDWSRNDWPGHHSGEWHRSSGPADEDWEPLPEWSDANVGEWTGDWPGASQRQWSGAGGDWSASAKGKGKGKGKSGELQDLLAKIAPQARITTSSTKLVSKASAEILKKIRVVTAEDDIGRGGTAEMSAAQLRRAGGGASSSNTRSFRESNGDSDGYVSGYSPSKNGEERRKSLEGGSRDKERDPGPKLLARRNSDDKAEDDEEEEMFLDSWNALFKKSSPLMTGTAQDPFKDIKEMRRQKRPDGKVVWKKDRKGHHSRYQKRKMREKAERDLNSTRSDDGSDYDEDYSWSPNRERIEPAEDHHGEAIMYSTGSEYGVQMQ